MRDSLAIMHNTRITYPESDSDQDYPIVQAWKGKTAKENEFEEIAILVGSGLKVHANKKKGKSSVKEVHLFLFNLQGYFIAMLAET